MESVRGKVGNTEVNTKVNSVSIDLDNSTSEIHNNEFSAEKASTVINSYTSNNVTPVETYDVEAETTDSTITIGNMTVTIHREDIDNPNNSGEPKIDIHPQSIYTDFLEEHGSTGDNTFGVDQGILGDLEGGNSGLIDFNINDILYDDSIEEKSLAEVLKERGNLDTVEGLTAFTDALVNGTINTHDMDFIGSLIIYISEAAPQASQDEILQKLLSLCENLNESIYISENDKFNTIFNKLKEMGFSEEDSLFIIENLDSIGACSYASTANAIFSRFKDNQTQFEMIFGFPMYDEDGTFNAEELLLDLYLFANSEENGGKLFAVDPNDPNKMTINYDPINSSQTMEEQVYITTSAGINENLLKEYLKSKGTSFTFICNSIEGVPDGTQVVETIQAALESGKLVSIGLHPKSDSTPIPMTLINDDGTQGRPVTINGGHSVYVTGITENGDLVISSWGKKYIISISDLNQSNTTINEIEIDNIIQVIKKNYN